LKDETQKDTSTEAPQEKDSADDVAALKKLGVEYDTNADGNVIEVIFPAKKSVDSSAWKAVRNLKHLETLVLDNTKLTDDDLENVQGLSGLQVLSIQENDITDAGLKHVKGLTNLINLALTKTKVTGKGLEHIAGLTKLQTLNLSFCNIGDDGLQHLAKMKDMEGVCCAVGATTASWDLLW